MINIISLSSSVPYLNIKYSKHDNDVDRILKYYVGDLLISRTNSYYSSVFYKLQNPNVVIFT